MRGFKRLAAAILACACVGACLTACGGAERETFSFSACVGEQPDTYDPIYAESVSEQTVIAHLYENLMRLTEDGGTVSVVPAAARSVDVKENGDGTVSYTFRLRETAWSDGMALRAADFVYAWQRLADPASASPYAALLSIVSGYAAARETGDMELLEVREKNDRTLVVTLDGHYDWFLREVCTSSATMPLRREVVQRLKHVAEEQNEKSGDGDNRWWFDPTLLVTNGPYRAESASEGYVKLVRNPHYTARESGADTLMLSFASAQNAATLYEEGGVQLYAPLTDEAMRERAEKDENWAAEPVLSTYCVLFRCDVLTDARVREAMGLVLDRNALASEMGAGASAATGLVPPAVPEGDGKFRENGHVLIENDGEGYEDRCARAHTLLEEAERADGLDERSLEYLYEAGGGRDAIARLLCETWERELHLHVTPTPLEKQELMSAVRAGDYTLAGVEIGAVCSEAECFLMNWTAGSGDNWIRYENSAYDTLMSIIAAAADGSARMGCLHDAEELLLKIDSAICPLCTDGTAWEMRQEFTGARRDARGWFDLTGVRVRPSNL